MAKNRPPKPGLSPRVARGGCECGTVTFAASGKPIARVACHCDDCQTAARELGPPEATGGAGTELILYREDRLEWSSGMEHLRDHRLTGDTATGRVVAGCSGAFILIRFDDSKHWVSIHRARFGSDAPPLEWRICTRFEADRDLIPDDVPAFKSYPARFIARLLLSGLATAVSPKSRTGRAGDMRDREISG